jgi:hypothetical protein
MQRAPKILGFLLLLAGICLPRVLALDRFATPDEAAWVGRSAAFYHALARRDFAGTFQHGHPGVTLTWAGTLAYRIRYPAMAWEADEGVLKNWQNVQPFLAEHGVQAIEILKTSRFIMVLGITAALGLAFLYAWRLVGYWPALTGFGLLALDPFAIGLQRLLHLDGLVSALMLLSLLAYVHYMERGRRWIDLFVAGLAAGLSWLTRSPALFLGLFFGLLALVDIYNHSRRGGRLEIKEIWRATWPLLAWAGIGAMVFVALWPAMWVDPVGSVGGIFSQAFDYAAEGHSSQIFFNGRVVEGDPGWGFYPLTFLWRSTPAVLIGLGLAAVAFGLRWRLFEDRRVRRTAIVLALFAVSFGVMMSLGAKKFDRYLLPSYGPLDLLAGIGWIAGLLWLWERGKTWAAWGTGEVFVAGMLASQMVLSLGTSPYYLSYYNPWMGGSRKAPEVMMIGWGEGLDQAARYLNTRPDAGDLRVMAHYSQGSFSYFFKGTVLDLIGNWSGPNSPELEGVDYLVLYIHQWQRQAPDPAMLAYFATQEPEYVVRIDGLDYAQVYNLHAGG